MPSSTGDWQAYGSTFGKVPAKNETIFGYKLHLLTTVGGVILDFELAPAHKTDLAVAYEMLVEHSDLDVLGDKAYISADKAAKLWQHNRLRLPTLPRGNQKKQLSPYSCKSRNWLSQFSIRPYYVDSHRCLQTAWVNWAVVFVPPRSGVKIPLQMVSIVAVRSF